MRLKTLLLAGSLICASMAAVQAQAAAITQRDSTYFITFAGGLDTAVTQYTVTTTLPAGGDDYTNASISYKSGYENFTMNTTGTVTTDFASPPAPGTTSETGNVYNGGGGGTWSFGYSTPNGPDFSTSWTMSTVANGHKVLAFGGIGDQGFGGCGSNLLDNGGIFTCEVFIQGHHAEGTGAGDMYITNLSPEYSVVSDFVYNSSLDATVLSVSTGAYDGTNPGLGLNIVGAPVPEPATWATMLAGFGGLGAAMRSRRRRPAAA